MWGNALEATLNFTLQSEARDSSDSQRDNPISF